MKTECIICAEPYTSKFEASCVYCKYTTCRTCVRQYVLNETEPKCMNCKKTWTREHQNAILKPAFVNKELKKHLEQVMFDRERAQFPETIGVLEERRQTQTMAQEIQLARKESDLLSSQYRYAAEVLRQNQIMLSQKLIAPKYFPEKTREQLEQECKNSEAELNNIRKKIRINNARITNNTNWIQMPYERRRIAMEHHIEGADPNDIVYTMTAAGIASCKSEKRKFVRACPIEECRGFLSTQWKCGVCGIHTCSKCHVPKTQTQEEDEHTCNPDDIATAELLEKDTRPCPQCGTGIFKIDGCDQMWCIECHCAFSWRTGQIESGNVHNPHFFEYQRRIGNNARNIMDMPCNALRPAEYHGVMYSLIVRVVNTNSARKREQLGIPQITRDNIAKLHVVIANCSLSVEQFVILMTNYRTDAVQNNLELRVKYLTEEINDAQFRSQLFSKTKKYNKNLEFGQVMQTVVYAMTDILTRLIDKLRETENREEDYNVATDESIFAILSETNALMNYANECLCKICVEYKITRVGIFIRDSTKHLPAGMYSVNVSTNPDGTETLTQKGRPIQH